ncbi:unnamed protein product [Urochloa humidicola]
MHTAGCRCWPGAGAAQAPLLRPRKVLLQGEVGCRARRRRPGTAFTSPAPPTLMRIQQQSRSSPPLPPARDCLHLALIPTTAAASASRYPGQIGPHNHGDGLEPAELPFTQICIDAYPSLRQGRAAAVQGRGELPSSPLTPAASSSPWVHTAALPRPPRGPRRRSHRWPPPPHSCSFGRAGLRFGAKYSRVGARSGSRVPSPHEDGGVQPKRACLLRLGERDRGVASRGDEQPVSRASQGGICKSCIIQTGQTDGLYMP